MARTTPEAVKTVLMADYGPLPDGTLPEEAIVAAIEEANILTTRLRLLAIQYKEITLATGSDTLEMVERLLAAHVYAMSDQPYASKSTGGASATFQGQTGLGLKGTKYGQRAMLVDYTRVLAALDEGKIATTSWLGKVPSEQINYSDRD